MTTDEKSEFRGLTGWLALIWFCYMLVPQIYPPRSLTTFDYICMLLIPVGAFLSARPGVSWRWMLFYGMLASIPFIFALMYKLRTSFDIASHFSEPSVSMIYLPCLLLLVTLVVVAAVGGTLGKLVRKRSSKPSC